MTELEKLLEQKNELEKRIKELQRQKIEIGRIGYEYKKISGRSNSPLFYIFYVNRDSVSVLLGETQPKYKTSTGEERKPIETIKVPFVIEKTKESAIASLEKIISELNQVLNEVKQNDITGGDTNKK